MVEFGVFENSKCIFLLAGQMSKKVAPLKNAHLQVHMYLVITFLRVTMHHSSE